MTRRRNTALALSLLGLLALAPAAQASSPLLSFGASEPTERGALPDNSETYNANVSAFVWANDPDGDLNMAVTCTLDGIITPCGPLTPAEYSPNSAYTTIKPFTLGAHTLTGQISDHPPNTPQATTHFTIKPDVVARVVTALPMATNDIGTPVLNWSVSDDHLGNLNQVCILDDIWRIACGRDLRSMNAEDVDPGPHF